MISDLEKNNDTVADALSLPLATVTKIAKLVTKDAQYRKETLEGIKRATALFILYLSDAASEEALQKKRKTINADDVMRALEKIDFEELITTDKTHKRNQKH